MGDDVARYTELTAWLYQRLGERVAGRVGEYGASLPRAQVVDRAARLLGDPLGRQV